MFLVDLLSNTGALHTLFQLRNTANAAQYINIRRATTTAIYVDVGGTFTLPSGIDRIPVWVWYTRTGTTHRIYLNGELVRTETADVSAWTFDEMYLCRQFDSTNWRAANYMGFREWSAALTTTQLKAEVNSTTPVVTSGLVTDTPLATDANDDSGNANHWTELGSVSYFTQGVALDLSGDDLDLSFTAAEMNSGARLIFFLAATTTKYVGYQIEQVGSDTPFVTIWPPSAEPANLATRADSQAGWIKILTGSIYVFRLECTSGAATETFSVHFEDAPTVPDPPPINARLINDDTEGLPATAWTSDGTFLGFSEAIPASEIGASTSDGHSLWHDRFQFHSNYLALLDPDLALVSAFNLPGGDAIDDSPFPRITQYNDDFYVLNVTTQALYKVTTAGVVTGPIATLTTITTAERRQYCAIAISNDGTILHYTLGNATGAIHRWSLETDTALADLYTIPGFTTSSDRIAGTAFNHAGDIVVLSDDSVVTWWREASPTQFKIIHVSSAGALIDEVTYTNATTDQINHLVRKPGSDDQVIAWFMDTAAETHGWIGGLRLSDGTEGPFTWSANVLMTAGHNAAYPDQTMFAPSRSCTFVLYKPISSWDDSAVSDESEPCCPCDCPDPAGPSGSPSSGPQTAHTGNILPPVDAADWTPLCTGGGDVPTAADPTDSETWVS